MSLIASNLIDKIEKRNGKLSILGQMGGEALVNGYISGVSILGGKLSDKIDQIIRDASKYLVGHSPPEKGAFKNIIQDGENLMGYYIGGIQAGADKSISIMENTAK